MAFLPYFFWGVTLDKILLILTTAVSLEAIYLAIFIQMSVNRTTKSLANVEENIDDLQEDIQDIQEDVEDIQEDIVSDDIEENDSSKILGNIEQQLNTLLSEISQLKKKSN